ncbi:MAG TPA: GNAT family acetyltransferase [Gemmataceae bacterium]
MHTLETDRLVLRMFRESDLDAYAEMCADAEVMRFLGDGRPMSRPEAWRHMAVVLGHWQLRGYGLWAVEERASGEMVGRVGCWRPEGWPGLEVGWALRRAWWGRGYATEAARAALRFAFAELGQAHVISLIRPGNSASVRVAERLGQRPEGAIEMAGSPALVYGIRREEWEAATGAAGVPRAGLVVRPFRPGDEAAVIALWERCGLTRPWNDPHKDVRRKLAVQPGLFLVGELGGEVVAAAMAGYDGHRGSVYYLGVAPEHRRKGFGRALMGEVDRLLRAAGCPKINLLVRSDNTEVIAFYEALGYRVEPIVCLGMRLEHDGPRP